MRVNDAIVGSLLIGAATWIFGQAQSFPNAPGQQFGPWLFPSIAAIGLALCGAKMVFDGLRARRVVNHTWIQVPQWMQGRRAILNMLSVPLAVLFYLYFAPVLGFMPTAFIMVASLALQFGGRLLPSLATAAIIVLLIHVAFYILLRVPLPLGLLQHVMYR